VLLQKLNQSLDVLTALRADSLDIIVATKKYEAEAIEQSIVVDVLGRDIPVASPEYLIILKLKAGEPRDILDVREILAANLVDRVLLAELATRYGVKLGTQPGEQG